MKLFSSFFSSAFSVILIICIFSFSSCATAPKKNDNNFVQEVREGNFYITELSNKIPVVIKESRNDSLSYSFALMFEGGSSIQNFSLAGIDKIIFSIIQKSIENDISSVEFFDDCTSDYSLLGLNCEKKIFDSTLNRFLNDFLSESISEDLFNQVIENQRKQINDMHFMPEQFFAQIRSQIFLEQPYAVSPYPTAISIENISYSDVLLRFEELKNASNIKIVSVGNFDERSSSSLILKLEKNFGNLKSIENSNEIKNKIEIKNEINKLSKYDFLSDKTELNQISEEDLDQEIVACIFQAPLLVEDDYIPFALASMIFENILRHELLGVQNIALSAGLGVLPGNPQLGIISVFGTRDTDKTIETIKASKDLFPSISDLNRVIMSYKRLYINQQVQAMHLSKSELFQIVTSLQYFDNPKAYTSRPVSVNEVNSEQIVNAFNKYLKSSSISCFSLE